MPIRDGLRMHSNRARIEVTATALMWLAAAFMVGSYLHDRASPGSPGPTIESWREDNNAGIRVGPAEAPVVVTVFTDFQCPYSARLSARLDTIIAEFLDDVAVVVQHYPLSAHPHAIQAAIAAECADRQGRFPGMARSLFSNRTSLGSLPWRTLAMEAAVPNLEGFERCVSLPVDSFPRIAYGEELGQRTGVRGTPTVWINGEVLGPPELEILREKIRKAR